MPARGKTLCPVLVASLAALIGCSRTSEIDSSAALTQALEAAQPGETLQLASGSFIGPFVIPAGVRLQGRGVGQTELVGGAEAGAAVHMLPGDGVTGLTHLRVVSRAGAAVVAVGDGCVELKTVEVYVQQGIGVGLQSLRCARLDDVMLRGAVTEGNLDGLPDGVDPSNSPSHGLIALAVADLTLDQVRVEGFAAQGVVLEDTTAQWVGGGVARSVGVGVLVAGGSFEARSVAVEQLLASEWVAFEYGLVSARGAQVRSTDLAIRDVPGTGILHDSGAALHTGLSVERSTRGGLWGQGMDTLVVSPEASDLVARFVDNRLAGVTAIDVGKLVMRTASVLGTAPAVRIDAELGPVEFGDGIHVRGAAPEVTLEAVTLEGNARVGFLASITSLDGLVANNVALSAAGEGLGALIQHPGGIEAWSAVSRDPVALANDASFVSAGIVLGVLSGVSPFDRPGSQSFGTLTAFGVSPFD